MATSTGKKIEWLVILPDQQGAIERRMDVRPYVLLSSSLVPTPHHSFPEACPLSRKKKDQPPAYPVYDPPRDRRELLAAI